jgi:hypothetical protein
MTKIQRELVVRVIEVHIKKFQKCITSLSIFMEEFKFALDSRVRTSVGIAIMPND